MRSLRNRYFLTTLWMVLIAILAVILITVGLILLLYRSAPELIQSLRQSLRSMGQMRTDTGIRFGEYLLLWLGLVSLCIIGVDVWLLRILSKSVIRPLNSLRDEARHIRDGELDADVLREQDQEFFEVSEALDDMRRRLKAGVDEEKRRQEERSMLSANLSHDLRSPVTTIRGYLEGLRDGIADTPEKQKRYLDTVYAKTLALEKTLDSMTEYAELELGRMQYHFAPMDLLALLRDAAEEASMDVTEAGLTFDAHLPEGEAIIRGDAGKLQRVLNNLISNAIKYNNPGGSVTLAAEIRPAGVLVTVTDTGIGIDAAETAQVFHGFYRGKQMQSGKIRGSGLGLAIVRQIAESHQGKVWLRSKPGEGTTASVLLPLLSEETHENTDY